MIPTPLTKKFAALLESQFKELRVEFIETHRILGAGLMFKPSRDETRHPYVEPGFKFMAKTELYHIYVHHRRIIQKKLFIIHPLMHKIFVLSINAFPEVMIDFKVYRQMGVLTIKAWLKLVEKEVFKWDEHISLNWYPEVVYQFTGKKSLADVPKKYRPIYVACAHNLIATRVGLTCTFLIL